MKYPTGTDERPSSSGVYEMSPLCIPERFVMSLFDEEVLPLATQCISNESTCLLYVQKHLPCVFLIQAFLLAYRFLVQFLEIFVPKRNLELFTENIRYCLKMTDIRVKRSTYPTCWIMWVKEDTIGSVETPAL